MSAADPLTPLGRRAWFRRAVFLLFLLLLWQGLASCHLWESVLFPAPLPVFRSLGGAMRDGSLFASVIVSLRRLVLGYGLSLLIGVPLGLLLGRARGLDDTLGTLTLGLQALPSVCWIPLAILWFGLGETGVLFVVVMGSLMALVLAVRDGVRNLPPLFLQAARALGATPRQACLHVVLPASLPAVLSGARLGWSFAWRSLMAAELLYVDRGLGALLASGRELHDMPRVVGVMLVIMFLGLLAERTVFAPLERALQVRWGSLGPSSEWGL